MALAENHQSDQLVLAIDVGTLSVRASVYDLAGNLVLFADKDIALTQLSDVKIEQDGVEIKTAVRHVIQQLLANPVRTAAEHCGSWAGVPTLYCGCLESAARASH